MTIKRRLFISNIFMIVIPAALSFAVIGIVIFFYMQIFSNGNMEQFRDDDTKKIIAQVQTMAKKWSAGSNLEQIITDIDTAFDNNVKDSIYICVYQENQHVYDKGEQLSTPIYDTALHETGNHVYVRDDIIIRSYEAGAYRILLADQEHYMEDNFLYDDYRMAMINIILVVVFLVVVIVLITNRLLTRYVFRYITTPLETLVYGVHQIRDGNLDYRIEYSGKDEYAQVVSDFNEMAVRLLEMVNARKKDDENRRELVAGISHDLRTPLTSIKAYVEGLEKGVATNPQMEKMYLDTIKRKTDDLDHIITQLFQFSKLDIGEYPFHMELLDLGNTLTNYVDRMKLEYQDSGVAIAITQNTPDCDIDVDVVQLCNVFTNILENARKYGSKENSMICVSCQKEHEKATIAFTDNGPGVVPEAIDRLFDIFYRSDKARTNTNLGSGLGLAISKKIIERFGGSIIARNVAKGGLCIEITLPIQKGGQDIEKNTDY